MEELERGIIAAESETDKDKILLEALRIKRRRDLRENSFRYYAATLEEIAKLCKEQERTLEELDAVCGLLYLASLGYGTSDGESNPQKQAAEEICYRPEQLQELRELQHGGALSRGGLAARYRESPYVTELQAAMKEPYYSVENSIELMLLALQDSASVFYPAKAGVARNH